MGEHAVFSSFRYNILLISINVPHSYKSTTVREITLFPKLKGN